MLAFLLRNTPADAATTWWPVALTVYAMSAAIVPWLAGGISRNELNPAFALVMLVVCAVPWWLVGGWLSDSPYPLIARAFRGLALLWALFTITTLMLALVQKAHRPR